MEPSQKEYRVAAAYRRCCWYLIAGTIALAAMVYLIVRFVLEEDPREITNTRWWLVLAPVALTIVVYLWKLRVDEEGIWRRRGLWWDLWSWSDLASGRIRKVRAIELYDRDRPWWRRKLRIDYMASADVRAVWDAINAHYVVPPAVEVPDELTIRYRHRRSARLDGKGIELRHGDAVTHCGWDDVQRVRVLRLESSRRDFWTLRIQLPDERIELKHFDYRPMWSGGTAEEVSEFLLTHVAADRIDELAAGEPWTNREDVEEALAQARKELRGVAIMTMFFGAAFLGIAAAAWSSDDVTHAIVVMVLFPTLFGALLVRKHRKSRKEVTAWADQLAALNAGEGDEKG